LIEVNLKGIELSYDEQVFAQLHKQELIPDSERGVGNLAYHLEEILLSIKAPGRNLLRSEMHLSHWRFMLNFSNTIKYSQGNTLFKKIKRDYLQLFICITRHRIRRKKPEVK
jgi:hypothetical protein